MILERQCEDLIVENEERNEFDMYMGLKQVNESDANSDFDPFWTENANIYPKLSPIAQDILSVPTLVESVFSKAGYCSSGRRNRLSGSTLETEILIKANKHYLL